MVTRRAALSARPGRGGNPPLWGTRAPPRREGVKGAGRPTTVRARALRARGLGQSFSGGAGNAGAGNHLRRRDDAVTTALAAITAVLATLVVVLLVLLVLRRPREAPVRARENDRPAPSPVPAVVESQPQAQLQSQAFSESEARLESRVRELTHALERAEYENRRGRFLAQLAGALDLDDVLARTLEAAHGLSGIDSAMIVLPQAGEGPLVATHGMSREEALSQPIAPPPEGRQPRAVSLNYRYAEPDTGRDGNLIRGGLMVPLVGLREQFIGTLAVFWRGRERDAGSQEVQLLEELAATAGPAIENAKRYLEARQLAEMDALTGLHN